jgi:hypothetical protein
MVTDTEKMLKRLDESVQELRLFFRTRQQLTESEQLFIENRLMILRIEYTTWARDKLAKKKTGSAANKKRPSADQTVNASDLPSR